jgi:hypothetical protein
MTPKLSTGEKWLYGVAIASLLGIFATVPSHPGAAFFFGLVIFVCILLGEYVG